MAASPGPQQGRSASPVVEVDWVAHERLNIPQDTQPLDEETARKGLSTLGRTPERRHAYLRMDVPELGLTSVEVIRGYPHLQFVNLANNSLKSLEALSGLRCLLHLNVSHNKLIRTQSFSPPEGLETVDMSYNLISDIGDWRVHKYLRELNLRGNSIARIGPGLLRNKQLRVLDLSENQVPRIENLEGLELQVLQLAQNKLSSVQGVGTLHKLRTLNVRRNQIPTLSALRPDEVPRLRKVSVSENQLGRIQEVEHLAAFPLLAELILAPNPVAELPHYRAQVLHRLPNLRLLDAQPAPAEEKVKADLIYGVDVAARKATFDELLPEETFLDRRLFTEELISDMELKQFGVQGDARPRPPSHGRVSPSRMHTMR